MDALESFPKLKEVIDSLALPEDRFSIIGSASKAALESLSKAGITQVDGYDTRDDNFLKQLRNPESLAADIVLHLENLGTHGFEACDPNSNIEIPTELKCSGNFTMTDTDDESLDVNLSIILHRITRALEPSEWRNPFVIFSRNKKNQFGEARKKQPDEFKGIFVQSLASKAKRQPKFSDTERLNATRDNFSWFCALNLTAEPEGEGKNSEMTVQMDIGSILRHTARLPKCEVLTDRTLNVPQFLKMSLEESSGTARPDIATKPVVEMLNPDGEYEKVRYEIIKALREPVIIVKEGKRANTGADVPLKDDKPNYTVQLAMAVFPALVALLVLYLKGKPFDPRCAEPLPKDHVIFTTYYDEKQGIVYVHFPYYDVRRRGWRFCQMKIAHYKFATSQESDAKMSAENARRRASLAIALQIIREHGRKLHERFTTLEYAKIVEALTEEKIPDVTGGSNDLLTKGRVYTESDITNSPDDGTQTASRDDNDSFSTTSSEGEEDDADGDDDDDDDDADADDDDDDDDDDDGDDGDTSSDVTEVPPDHTQSEAASEPADSDTVGESSDAADEDSSVDGDYENEEDAHGDD
ncbi:hypothetical protein EIP86_008306 [Pleurotus ostreatoroseus]|nr:hypothetical protein EIP86_008306 [Pleurotus ostreatoroseus]